MGKFSHVFFSERLPAASFCGEAKGTKRASACLHSDLPAFGS
jgi:hypothetical protein